MVLAHDTKVPVSEALMERRPSSPIGIPNSKLATLRKASETTEDSTSPVSSPGNYGSLPTISTSLPAHSYVTRALHENGPSITQKTDSIESIGEILDKLPQGSPAFSTVFSEIVKLDEEERKKNEEAERKLDAIRKAIAENEQSAQHGTPQSRRKESKSLKFAENTHTRNHFRPRAVSASSNLKPSTKESPSSTNSTPALSRRSRTKHAANKIKVVNVAPKFKFLTETITVSHEDIVKEQAKEKKQIKSIFGVAEERYHLDED